MFLPATCNLSKLKHTIESARSIPESHPIIIVLFHGYDFVEVDRVKGSFTYQDFLSLLSWIRTQNDVSFLNIDQATKVIDDLSYLRLIKYKSFIKAFSLLPSFLQPSKYRVYLSQNISDELKIKFWVITLIFYFLLFVLIFCTSICAIKFLIQKTNLHTSFLKYTFIALVILLSIGFYIISFRGPMGHKRAIIIVILFGMCISIWVLLRTKPKNICQLKEIHKRLSR
jgi:hypothetical protein